MQRSRRGRAVFAVQFVAQLGCELVFCCTLLRLRVRSGAASSVSSRCLGGLIWWGIWAGRNCSCGLPQQRTPSMLHRQGGTTMPRHGSKRREHPVPHSVTASMASSHCMGIRLYIQALIGAITIVGDLPCVMYMCWVDPPVLVPVLVDVPNWHPRCS